jgi:hypothetical protein
MDLKPNGTFNGLKPNRFLVEIQTLDLLSLQEGEFLSPNNIG